MLFIISVIVGIVNISLKELSYNKIDNIRETEFIGIIVSEKNEKEYKNQYEIIYKNKKFLLYTNKSTSLRYGDKVKFKGELQNVSEDRNYKGFNYKLYLRSKNIYGIINTKNVNGIGKNKVSLLNSVSNLIKNRIKEKVEQNLPKESANLLLALIIGDKTELDEEIIKNFRINNLAHILAISGMHISYIILGMNFIINKLKIPKNKANWAIILLLIMFIFITGFSPSVIRGSIMGIILLVSKSFHLKFDFWTAISLSLLIILFGNPFAVFDIGLELSYIGTISIVIFSKVIKEIRLLKNDKINEAITACISAQILLLPITVLYFNNFSTYFLISNILCSPLVGIIIILGFLTIIISFFLNPISEILYGMLNIVLKILIYIPQAINKLPFSNFHIKTPNYFNVFLYYLLMFFWYILTNLKHKQNLRRFEKIILRSGIIQKIILIIIIFCIIFNLSINMVKLLKNELKIYFVDVGQGDCTLIITPKGRNVLLDGGENNQDILLPYLLDRKITKLDYIVISHFDSDHCNGIIYVMKELKVDNVIIGKQYEESENYSEFLKIAKDKRIKVYVVEAGQKINIEKNLSFETIWPNKNDVIKENILNNNSMICKLKYLNFSMLFTGDIEDIAEKAIIKKYEDSNILNSTVLKVAHHGSKTSSTEEFIKKVSPQIALIGVGENNKFGHPNEETINVLEKLNCKIYRTDNDGEITIISNGNNVFKINIHIK